MAIDKAGAGWLFKMAWRDARASLGRMFLFMASIVLGIAAVVSIHSFGETLRDNIALQSKSLMGADYIIDSSKPVNARVEQIIDSLGGAAGREISFPSMVLFPENDATKLVQVRGIDGDFPFYGELETSPATAAQSYQKQDGALVDATVMVQLGIKVGDSIKVGDIILPIAGSLEAVPGSSSLFSSIAPPIIIPYKYIDQSGLVQMGSRVDYKYYFLAKPTQDMRELDERVEPVLDREEADLDTHISTSERLGRRYENFGRFLNLVAFIALLLGCVGIASAINIYIRGKLGSLAVLKCLGATQRQSFMIYLVQIAAMGIIGGLLGSLLGLVLQQFFPYLLGEFLPIDVEVSISYSSIVIGVVLGLVMSVLFGLHPLMSTLYVSPLQALRVTQSTSQRSRRATAGVLLGILAFIFLFGLWLLRDAQYSLYFTLGIVLTFLVLIGVATLFIRMVKKFFPRNWGFVPRQSLLNLFRPQNQTLILVLAIGVGTFLISTLYFTKDMLLAQATLDSQVNSPNIILLDVQQDQMEDVANTVKNENLPVLSEIPIVTMRVQELKGRNVNEIRQDTTDRVNRWILNHEFRVTYRDSLISSESLMAGKWIPRADEGGIIPISISSDFARDAGVDVGDEVVFNVQGRLMTTQVASIRMVDWSRMQLNFSLVFPQGVLEKAPQFGVITTKVPGVDASAALQRKLVRSYPNLSIIDLRQVLSVIEDILGKISWIINFMAFFSILTGIVVLLGAVRTSKYQRIKESVLLRTLGAKSSQILKILALEYAYLGILGALTGILLSLVSSLLLAWLVFDSSFVPSLFPFLVLLPGITLLVVGIGLGNSVEVVKSPPLQVLRKEAL